jgi:hypothetical protein
MPDGDGRRELRTEMRNSEKEGQLIRTVPGQQAKLAPSRTFRSRCYLSRGDLGRALPLRFLDQLGILKGIVHTDGVNSPE